MIGLPFVLGSKKALRVLCIGAHCDDIEIGCGATLLRLAGERPLDVTWLILCSTPQRAAEARSSAAAFLRKARTRTVNIETFRDGYLPAQWAQAKECIESLKAGRGPRSDLHPRAARSPPGSPDCVRVDVEHVPGPRDSRVRDSQVRRLPWAAQPVRLGFAGSRRAQDASFAELVRDAKSKALVFARDFLCADALARHRMQRADGLAEAFHARKLVI